MRIRYAANSVADLHELVRYAREHLEEDAEVVLGATIREAVEGHLRRFPEMGKEGQVPGTRKLVLTKLNLGFPSGPRLWVHTRATDQQARRRAADIGAREDYEASSTSRLRPWQASGISHRT